MGTNYYLKKNCWNICGRPSEEIHIGKSSFGWCFLLHVTNEIKTLEDWISLFNERKYIIFRKHKIFDEYGREISIKEMESIILDRKHAPWKENSHYKTPEEFYNANNAESGPNNLARCKLGGGCVGHGDGTYDLITGYFS